MRGSNVKITPLGDRVLVKQEDEPQKTEGGIFLPETAKEAPTFAKLFPKIPPAFDNNHMLHDVVSDILTSAKVISSNIRIEGIKFGRMAQDPEAFKDNNCPMN